MDFTLTTYERLLKILQTEKYPFQTFESFTTSPLERVVILRHDVDRLPTVALKMAKLEHELGVTASYYFRAVPASWDEEVMTQVVSLGHELGYHYEDLALFRGDQKKAIRHFKSQLDRMRRIYPVKTICMHGSPLSRHDNRDLWNFYDYRDFGITGDPYFDTDFNDVFYLTDTGRSWNNKSASLRDKVDSTSNIHIRDTYHLIELANEDILPPRMMITVHPQRWHDKKWPWIKELVGQQIKNIVKGFLVKKSLKKHC